ncbi:MAG TPA: choline kinase family protein [Baekduia sp.]|nr:choline kinase family protein [Baekduia sp.]
MAPPRAVIEAVQDQLGALAGEPSALGGGITNHNFRARFGATEVVLRIAGRDTDLLGIDRAAEQVATQAAAELGIAPAVLASLPEHGCMVTAFVDAAPIAEQALREPPALPEVARALRAFHERAPSLPARFEVSQLARDYLALARDRGAELPPAAWDAAALAKRIAAAVAGHPEHASVPCHDDLLAANILSDGRRVWLVDWEYAGMGDRYFDLGNLSINNGFTDADDRALLEAYWNAPCTPRRFAALRVMRSLSDVREALWGVVQQAVSELDFDFGAYADKHLRRLAATTADPRFESWLRDAATP